ncbi:MAG TPA: L-seryl-tRNA(Sec) selenium transferase [Pyrinomonadaceae bacterium]|nr:L-seryl-tRNA(Sec) selenium transferase [Pyrinomonadaceae bacterium]
MSGVTKKIIEEPGRANNAGLAELPSVDQLLREADNAGLISKIGRMETARLVRELLTEKRRSLSKGNALYEIGGSQTRELYRQTLLSELQAAVDRWLARRVQRLINASGVVIHTNMGRAPLSDAARAAMAEACGYSSIEYDIEGGSRGKRGFHAIELIKALTGAEDALVVNNCAAAALLILSVFARGRDVIVSRGELVEIGGDFRIPDVLERSGAILREVGTTNRTHLRDFESAIGDSTAMILKVHPSNYRITGFQKRPETRELAELAAAHDLIFYEDAGSGALVDLSELGVSGEPVISDVIAAGADLVSFSGDKLLGGPQAGIIAGKAKFVQALAKDPFFRALRVDKSITAALERTLESYLTETNLTELPVHRMLNLSRDEIAERSARIVGRLSVSDLGIEGFRIELCENESAVGGGASPDSAIKTTVIAMSHSDVGAEEIQRALRRTNPPVIARIEEDRVLIDIRTVDPAEEEDLVNAVNSVIRTLPNRGSG